MKVALVTDYFITGGGLEHICQIVKYLPHINFGVFAKKGEAVEKFSSYPNVQIFSGSFSPAQVNYFRPDIIHFHHLMPLAFYYTFPFISRTIPVLFTLHGAHIHKYEFKHNLKSKLGYQLRYHSEKYLFNKVDQLITVTQDDLACINKLYNINMVTVIPNGIDIRKYSGIHLLSRTEIRKEHQLPQNSFIFLTVARYDFAKGYDILVRAIKILKDLISLDKAKFIFVGEGREFPEILSYVKRNYLEPNIIFFKRYQDLKKLFVACDAFILPSRWEGMALVLLETGYCKLPVMASNTFGIREIIKNQQTGLLFANEDSKQLATLILDIMEHRYNLKNMSENLYQKVIREYDLSKSIGRLEQIYNEMYSG